MNMWKRCPKCFWLKYMMHVPEVNQNRHIFSYGSYIHSAIESKQRGEEITGFEKMIEETADISLAAQAKKHLEKYEQIQKKLRLSNGMSEVEFFIETDLTNPVDGGKICFNGFIDRVEYSKCTKVPPKKIVIIQGKIKAFADDGTEVEHFKISKIIEYKTSKKKYGLKQIATEYQFTLYWIVAKMLPRSTSFMAQLVVFLKNDAGDVQVAKITRNDKDVQNFWEETERVLSSIEGKNLPPVSTCGYFSPYGETCVDFDPLTIKQ